MLEIVTGGDVSNKQKQWLKSTRKFADQSQFPNYPMAAIIVKGGRPVAFGLNKKTPGILKDKRYGLSKNGYLIGVHAELSAVLDAARGDIRGATCYISGSTKGGRFILSKPCERCLAVLIEAGIKKIVYHCDQGIEYVAEIVKTK